MKLVKVAAFEWNHASRDIRELSVARELGLDVCVMAKGNPEDKGRLTQVDGFDVYLFSSKPFQKLPRVVNRVSSIFLWADQLRKMEPDIISGHDIAGLTIGWLSTIGCRRNVYLIYDAHEYEYGRNAKRNALQNEGIRYLERFMCKRSDLIMVVNDSIADLMTELHHLKTRPLVIRNIPNTAWKFTEDELRQVRASYRKALGGGKLVSYHGAVVEKRGIEQMIAVLAKDPQLKMVVTGDFSSEAYRERLMHLIEEKGVQKRVLFQDAVPHEELGKYISVVDLGCVLIETAGILNHYYSLPNKLFELIAVGVPVIGSDLPEIGRIIKDYGIGLVCDQSDPDAVYAAVRRLLNDRALYRRCKENMARAQQELNWDKEKQGLKKAYTALMNGTRIKY